MVMKLWTHTRIGISLRLTHMIMFLTTSKTKGWQGVSTQNPMRRPTDRWKIFTYSILTLRMLHPRYLYIYDCPTWPWLWLFFHRYWDAMSQILSPWSSVQRSTNLTVKQLHKKVRLGWRNRLSMWLEHHMSPSVRPYQQWPLVNFKINFLMTWLSTTYKSGWIRDHPHCLKLVQQFVLRVFSRFTSVD